MKATELIVQLQELVNEKGDLPVYFNNICGDYGVSAVPVNFIEFEKDKWERERIIINKVY